MKHLFYLLIFGWSCTFGQATEAQASNVLPAVIVTEYDVPDISPICYTNTLPTIEVTSYLEPEYSTIGPLCMQLLPDKIPAIPGRSLKAVEQNEKKHRYPIPADLPLSSDSIRLPLSYWLVTPGLTEWTLLQQGEFAKYQQRWKLPTTNPIEVEAINEQGEPVVNAEVILFDSQGQKLYTAQTGLSGRALLWVEEAVEAQHIEVAYGTASVRLDQPVRMSKGSQQASLPVSCQQLPEADIVFLLDATQSMQDEFSSILPTLKSSGKKVMLARDQGERYLVQAIEPEGAAFTYRAAGGGQDTESIDAILKEAIIQHDWNAGASSRLLVYITDALPAYSEAAAADLNRLVQLADEKGVKILPVAASGINEEGEYLLQSLAMMTGGTYAWLEDSPHTEALHRFPLLQGDPAGSSLDQWIEQLISSHAAIDRCEDIATQPSVGIAEEAQTLIRCYPNPAVGQATLELPEEAEKISVYDSKGSLYTSWRGNLATNFTIQVADWPAGIYRIEVAGYGSIALSVVRD
jgi:hypothetical protein